MMKLTNEPMVRLESGAYIPAKSYEGDLEVARGNTLSARILDAHNISGNPHELHLKFDLLASPDDNYTSILQEVRAMECRKFKLPWYFSNCHNALACTGGTINNDDHVFGFDCVKKYGGIYLPPYSAVIHQYMREQVAAGGQLILASDSHTRYGCLGAMGIGEGGTEVARQAMGGTYDIRRPQV
ncbi:MAG: hydratase, partial [Clostridia bacterium]|nr:hydratase [Clostridia bacterium]